MTTPSETPEQARERRERLVSNLPRTFGPAGAAQFTADQVVAAMEAEAERTRAVTIEEVCALLEGSVERAKSKKLTAKRDDRLKLGAGQRVLERAVAEIRSKLTTGESK